MVARVVDSGRMEEWMVGEGALEVGAAKDNLKIQIPPSLIINKRRKQQKNEPTTKLEPLLTGGGLLVGSGGPVRCGGAGGIVFNLNTFSTERNVLKANTGTGTGWLAGWLVWSGVAVVAGNQGVGLCREDGVERGRAG